LIVLGSFVNAAVQADPVWITLEQAFRSIKGVAGRIVARIMAEMPKIATLSNKAVVKLAGLAPISRDSGKQAGKRSVQAQEAGPHRARPQAPSPAECEGS
jgi:transposase